MRADLTLCLAHHDGVLLLLIGQTLHESIHIKCVELAILLLVPVRPPEILSVRIHQARKTPNERYPDTILVERLGANKTDKAEAPSVGIGTATGAFIDAIMLGALVADSA